MDLLDEASREARVYPYFTTLPESSLVNLEVENIISIFEKLVTGQQGFIDVDLYDMFGAIPISKGEPNAYYVGRRLEVTHETNHEVEPLEDYALWVTEFIERTRYHEDLYGHITLMKFDNDDEQLAVPTAQLFWIIYDGELHSVAELPN
jgi:hypothetical protein